MLFSDADLVFSYSRSQALDDGELVAFDADLLREIGVLADTAMTAKVWDLYVGWTEKDSRRQTYQDCSARAFDVLYMGRKALRAAAENPGGRFGFKVCVVARGGRGRRAREVTLIAVCSNGEFTIMLPTES